MRYVGHRLRKTEGKGGPDATGSGRSAAIYRHRGYRQYHRRSGECPSGLASASERLRKMEAEIGVPLLHRHARGVTMTEAGEVLARHARPLLAQQQRLRRAMHAFACGQRGRCACSPTPRRCRPFCRESSPHGWQRTRRCRSKPKNAPARISSAVSRRAWRRPEWCPMRSTPGRCASIPSLTTRWC